MADFWPTTLRETVQILKFFFFWEFVGDFLANHLVLDGTNSQNLKLQSGFFVVYLSLLFIVFETVRILKIQSSTVTFCSKYTNSTFCRKYTNSTFCSKYTNVCEFVPGMLESAKRLILKKQSELHGGFL